MSTMPIKKYVFHLDRSARWAFYTALLSGLYYGIYVFTLAGSKGAALPPRLWLIAALSAGLCTFVIDWYVLKRAQYQYHLWRSGILVGIACALLPHPLYWLIDMFVEGPPKPLTGYVGPIMAFITSTIITIVTIGLAFIPVSIIVTFILLKSYPLTNTSDSTTMQP